MGKYASDAYWMFCRGRWRDLCPDDKDLKRYHAWLAATDGQGEGLARDVPLHVQVWAPKCPSSQHFPLPSSDTNLAL